jgi:hypothetical protein
MWKPSSKGQRAAAFAGMLAVVIAAGGGSAYAQAAGNDDDEALDTKMFRRFMQELGFRQNDIGIDYRERAPLVVPPSRKLPPPQTESAGTRNPAWPKDPDVARSMEATATEKAKLKGYGDRPTEDSRPLRPDELDKPRGQTAATGAGGGASGPGGDESARPLSPSQLGVGTTQSMWEKMFSAVNPNRAESAPFTGEPPRTSMTAPPPGYQTPSPNYPYGGSPTSQPVKPPTLESRMEPAR